MSGAVRDIEAREELAAQMLPVATNLAALVQGDGGAQDIEAVLASLDEDRKSALIVVLAALVDMDRSVADALWWLQPVAGGSPMEPEWPASALLRDLAAEPSGQDEDDEDLIDPVAVEAYLQGRPVRVTPRERLEAVIVGVRRGMAYPDIDAVRGLRHGMTSTFVSRTRKRYAKLGQPFPEIEHRSGVALLTDEQVLEARRLGAAGATDEALALRFGVVRETMRAILSGGRYGHVGGPIRVRPERLGPYGINVLEKARWMDPEAGCLPVAS